MDRESLERLAIERAVGALSPEVEALLADYLARDPAAAGLVDEFAETARLAKDAFGGAPSVAPPPFPLGQLRAARQTMRRRTRLENLAAVAVSLVVGIGVGVLVSRRPAPAEAPVGPFTAHEIVDVAPRPIAPAVEEPSPSFWSRERLAERALAAPSARPPRLVWTSPIRQPKTEVPHGTLDPGA